MLPYQVLFSNEREIAVYEAVMKLGMCTKAEIKRAIRPAKDPSTWLIDNQINSLIDKEMIHIVGRIEQGRYVYAPLYRGGRE